MTIIYKIFTFITTITFYLYNTINIIHKYTLNCKDLSKLVQFSYSILLLSCSPFLTNLQLQSIYTASGGIAK